MNLSNWKKQLYPVAGTISVLVLVLSATLAWFRPELGLKILWSGVVPLVPMLLFLGANLWVSVCPFAFLQWLPHRIGLGGKRKIPASYARVLGHASWLLLFILVPLRHFVFDVNGVWLVLAMIGIAVFSLLSGFLFQGLSGWCNSLCPVRPVEYLYGRHSLDSSLPAPCIPCSACTDQCGRIRKTNLENHLSKIAYAFPGFVFAFFHTSGEQPLLRVYLDHFVAMSASFFLLLAVRSFVSHAAVLKLSGVAAISLYYFLTIPRIGLQWGWTEGSVAALRTGVLMVILGRAVLMHLGERREIS